MMPLSRSGCSLSLKTHNMGNRGFDAWPTDGAGWVKAEVDHFGSISNAMAYLHRRLVGAIRETALPVKIEGISYNPAAEPPDAEHMYDESVLIDFAPYDRSYAEPLFESEHPRNVFYDGVHAAWQKNGFRGDSCIFEYYRKYSFHSLPVLLLKLISEELPYYAKTLGVDGLGCFTEPGDWIPYEPTMLLIAALSWDADLDGASYVESYLRDRYGPAAGAVGVYLAHVERAGRAIFDRPRGNYQSIEAVSGAKRSYALAREALAGAESRLVPDSDGAFMVERLGWNLDYAIADTDISYHQLRSEFVEADRSKQRAERIAVEHQFDGVVMNSWRHFDRYSRETRPERWWMESTAERLAFYEAYRSEWE